LTQYRGFAIVGNNTDALNTGIHIGNTPYLIERESSALLYSDDPGFVLREGSTSNTLIADVDGYDLDWGTWSGSSDALKYQYHLSNGAIYNLLDGNVIMVSTIPTEISNLSGTHYYAIKETLTVGEPFIGSAVVDTLDKVVNDINAAFLTTWSNYQNALQMLNLESENLDAARSILKIGQKQYELGSINEVQFRQIQLSSLRAESNYLEAKFNAKSFEIDLLRLSGTLIQEVFK
jgi:hypothetical protein